jgi:formylglycine-generating enzyme required for sulfatase activity
MCAASPQVLRAAGGSAIRAGVYSLFRSLAFLSLMTPCARSADPAPPEGMVFIKGGTFSMGSTDGPSDERPVHEVTVKSFFMDRTEVTNAQFEAFTKATKYLTVAERPLSAKDIPGLLPEFEGKTLSLCFRAPKRAVDLRNSMQWWAPVVGSDWRHPDGPGSDLTGREKHPVVHVAWEDAVAYCKWAGKRLPTEAEWEYAARGGAAGLRFVWGNEFNPAGKWMANTWQGRFPSENTGEDGYKTTAPVGTYQPNGFGLFDMAGNVWEWCADWYLPEYYARSPKENPPGPDTSFDPDEPGTMKRVTRGGSWMCADSYCRGYRPGARMKTSPDTGLQNTGFRCVKDIP